MHLTSIYSRRLRDRPHVFYTDAILQRPALKRRHRFGHIRGQRFLPDLVCGQAINETTPRVASHERGHERGHGGSREESPVRHEAAAEEGSERWRLPLHPPRSRTPAEPPSDAQREGNRLWWPAPSTVRSPVSVRPVPVRLRNAHAPLAGKRASTGEPID